MRKNRSIWIQAHQTLLQGQYGMAVGDKYEIISYNPNSHVQLYITGKKKYIFYFTFEKLLAPFDKDVEVKYLGDGLVMLKMPVITTTVIWSEWHIYNQKYIDTIYLSLSGALLQYRFMKGE
jgi:hypothetical protein